MRKRKLSMDDLLVDFHLIGIHAHLKDYRLAYLINQQIRLNLIKTESIINTKNKAVFSVFEHEDLTHYRKWYLINNHAIIPQEVDQNHNLFSDNMNFFNKKVFYLKELKKIPFLLKIEAEKSPSFFEKVIQNLKSIPQVYTAESINLSQLKNINQLTF